MSTREKSGGAGSAVGARGSTVRCELCPRGCALPDGATGACRARGNVDGTIVPIGYACVTSLAVDPVEKKPLARWKSGHSVLSLGSFGCNLRCPWCQNSSISQVGEDEVPWRRIEPREVAELAARLHAEDPLMAGVAYTYNEPLVAWEFVRDCAREVRAAGLSNVLVSAGCVAAEVVSELAPLIDAANIDLKSFSAATYQAIGGDLATVKRSIQLLADEPGCHLEVTTLVVPGVNDSEDEMRELSGWLASLDTNITLHVTRFHPSWHMLDREPTPVADVYRLADVAREQLAHVYTGNC